MAVKEERQNDMVNSLFDEMNMDNAKILFIVPAYNEEGNVANTIREIKKLQLNSEILVVNDCSVDKTSDEAKSAGALVADLPFNLGIGGAVQTGIKYAKRYDFDIAIQVDGDGQHDVGYIQELIAPIINDEVDMVIGSRFLPPFLGFQSSFIRRIGINFFAVLISFLTQCKTTDPTSGFRAFDRKVIQIFDRYYPHDFPEPEAIVVARRYGARIKEVPVQMRKRASGRSSIRYLYTLYYMIKVTVAIVLDKLKTRKSL